MARARKILILNGHPDPSPERLGRALALAYAEGASAGGHDVRVTHIAELSFPILRSKAEFDGEAPDVIVKAQDDMRWAEHIVLVYPLWHGMLPAFLKAFLEQVFRAGFAMHVSETGWTPMLKGKSARVVVTMGMPTLFYRFYFFAHSLAALRRNILGFSGMAPVRTTLYGMIETVSAETRAGWLEEMRALGRRAT
ncbi:MAG: NAD(P)H-dependent oxidoreductase [Hyphomicrobiaceae bacterium]